MFRRELIVTGLLTVTSGCIANSRPDKQEWLYDYQKEIDGYGTYSVVYLSEGEQVSAREGDEQFLVTILDKNGSRIDIRVDKIIVDEHEEEGAPIDIMRKDIEPYSVEEIEDDFKVWYIKERGDEVKIAVGGTHMNPPEKPDNKSWMP